jgi:myo-inositol-1(or 4)-monophosphatase
MISYRNFAVDLATQAGTLLKERFQPTGTPATLKSDHSFVTEADLAADRLITQAIHQYAPAELILSEEMHTGIDSIEPAVWIVDPLDGTTNYSLGMQVWGVSIARLVAGEPVLGVLYFPLTGEIYVAEKGLGAFCNDRRIHVQGPDPSRPWPFFACCSRTHRRYSVDIPYKPRIYGSAAYSFCMLARGAACVTFEATPKVWDLAAVWLLVGEAGGSLARLKGETPFPLSPYRDYAKVSYPTLAAASNALLEVSLGQITAKS